MDKLDTILVGVDFSDCSETALIQAARLARENQAKLHIVHIIDALVLDELREVLKAPAGETEVKVRQDTRREVDEMIGRVKELADVQVEITVGSVVDEIIRKAKETSADLLVMGTRGSGRPAAGAGTVALKCVRQAPTPVLLVRSEARDPFRVVAACIDFTNVSASLVEFAARAAGLEGGKVHLVHAFAPPWKRLHYGAPTPEASVFFQREYRHALEARLEGYTHELPEELRNKVPFQCDLVEDSNYSYGILDHLNNIKADLVVLGNEGHSGLRYFFLGSTAERVIMNAPCSILAIKPKQ